MKLKIILFGASGKMGVAVQNCLSDMKAGTWESAKNKIGGLGAGVRQKGLVAIDFTHAETFSDVLKRCVEAGVPLVSGTTGISSQQKRAVQAAAKKIPIVWAPNMSPGINILNEIIKTLAGPLAEYDVALEEAHHKHKKDRPSGTALQLKETYETATNKKMEDVMSVRGGGVFGVHKLIFMGQEEVLSIEHVALNRQVFARGAIMAAKWIVGKKPGAYGMSDVIRNV